MIDNKLNNNMDKSYNVNLFNLLPNILQLAFKEPMFIERYIKSKFKIIFA